MRETLENEVTGARFVFRRRGGNLLFRMTTGKKTKREAEEKPENHAQKDCRGEPTLRKSHGFAEKESRRPGFSFMQNLLFAPL